MILETQKVRTTNFGVKVSKDPWERICVPYVYHWWKVVKLCSYKMLKGMHWLMGNLGLNFKLGRHKFYFEFFFAY